MRDISMLAHLPDHTIPVINITTGSIVLLPESCWHSGVKEKKPNYLVFLPRIGMMGLEDKHYQILLKRYKFKPYTETDLSFDFFFMRCMEAVGDNENMRMDKQAYQYIYDRLRKSNYSIQYILEGLLENILSYREVGLLDGLEWLGINHQHMGDGEKRQVLVQGMKEKQGWCYRTHYSVDSAETVLFENLEDYY